MKKRYIGLFDSGLGGLTTAAEILRQMPHENIVFLGDTAHMPYGSRTKEEIVSLTLRNVETLQKYDLKALVIACNTSDSNASPALRERCKIPLFGVIAPAARQADEATRNRRIGLIATESTVRSGRYEEEVAKIDDSNEVFSVACPKLVPLIEDGVFLNDPETMKEVLSGYLLPLKEKQVDTLILGCTHYDVLSEMARDIMGDIAVVSSSRCVVSELKNYLEENDLRNKDEKTSRIYYVTSDPERFRKTASSLIEDIRIRKIAV